MARNGDGVFRVLRIKKGESRKSIYAKARKAFTAADLQRYTVEEEMFPAADLLKEFEESDKKVVQQRKSKKAAR
jgi:hypothetical protein